MIALWWSDPELVAKKRRKRAHLLINVRPVHCDNFSANSINSPHRYFSACCSPTGFAGSVERRRGVGGGSEKILRCRVEIGQASFSSGGEFSEFPREGLEFDRAGKSTKDVGLPCTAGFALKSRAEIHRNLSKSIGNPSGTGSRFLRSQIQIAPNSLRFKTVCYSITGTYRGGIGFLFPIYKRHLLTKSATLLAATFFLGVRCWWGALSAVFVWWLILDPPKRVQSVTEPCPLLSAQLGKHLCLPLDLLGRGEGGEIELGEHFGGDEA